MTREDILRLVREKVHHRMGRRRLEGAVGGCEGIGGVLRVEVGVQASVVGLYRPPVFSGVLELEPPQMIIRSPVQTATCLLRAVGAPVREVGDQVSATGS